MQVVVSGIVYIATVARSRPQRPSPATGCMPVKATFTTATSGHTRVCNLVERRKIMSDVRFKG